MQTPNIRTAVLTALLCLASAGPVFAQEEPRQVPAELAEILSGAQELLRQGRPAEAISRLATYQGTDHALRQLLLGHANARQSNNPAAIAAYQAALRMDPKLSQAGMGLAQVYAVQNKWGQATGLLGRFVATDSCDADTLLLYAQVAQRNEDARLCELLVDKAIRRFPSDLRFRRLDMIVRIDQQDNLAAGSAIDMLLRANPADPELWRQRAFVSDRADKQADAIAALEACVLCDPNDLAKHRRFVTGLVIAGDWRTAVMHGRSLFAGPLAKSAAADVKLMGLLIRAADSGQDDATLGKWLALVPEKSRTLDMGIVATRGNSPRRRRTGPRRKRSTVRPDGRSLRRPRWQRCTWRACCCIEAEPTRQPGCCELTWTSTPRIPPPGPCWPSPKPGQRRSRDRPPTHPSMAPCTPGALPPD